jgi:hypothetical protein
VSGRRRTAKEDVGTVRVQGHTTEVAAPSAEQWIRSWMHVLIQQGRVSVADGIFPRRAKADRGGPFRMKSFCDWCDGRWRLRIEDKRDARVGEKGKKRVY